MKTRTLLALAASALLGWTAGPALAQESVSLRVAYVQAPDHPHGLGIRRFAELVQQKSANRIEVKTFGSATLGGDVAVLSSLRGGTVDMTVVIPSLLTGMAKEFVLLDLPFLFGSYAEADAVLDGPVGKRLLELLPDKGLIGLGYWDHGFRIVTNSRRAITKVEDFAGLKLRVPQSTIFIETFTALGANAVPMPIPELYSALETRAMDGQENPYAAVEALKLQEVQKFASATNHAYNPLVVVFSKMKWDKLAPADRQILMDAAAEAGAYERKVSREANDKAAESLKAKGLQLNTVGAAELARMREKVGAVNAKYIKEGGEKLAAEMMGEIAKVRGKP
ncbi:TRAP transporter substrate-binding protein [Pseudorhodoferax sp.]|uniref:TRAP transporter substrate-binding protein n=1 Tax=Pseudorhodoferax sp. TaxID=1993553 RepID=UPI002DD690B5|nr:TRAP transporter substrate-binding protein [Pseudorhodoferax sp.]